VGSNPSPGTSYFPSQDAVDSAVFWGAGWPCPDLHRSFRHNRCVTACQRHRSTPFRPACGCPIAQTAQIQLASGSDGDHRRQPNASWFELCCEKPVPSATVHFNRPPGQASHGTAVGVSMGHGGEAYPDALRWTVLPVLRTSASRSERLHRTPNPRQRSGTGQSHYQGQLPAAFVGVPTTMLGGRVVALGTPDCADLVRLIRLYWW